VFKGCIDSRFSTTPNACSSECWIKRITAPPKSGSLSCGGAIRRCPVSDFISRSSLVVGSAVVHRAERRTSSASPVRGDNRQTSPAFRRPERSGQDDCLPSLWYRSGISFHKNQGHPYITLGFDCQCGPKSGIHGMIHGYQCCDKHQQHQCSRAVLIPAAYPHQNTSLPSIKQRLAIFFLHAAFLILPSAPAWTKLVPPNPLSFLDNRIGWQ
jgi:hypothetical protein